jgi:hypothetical protein
MLKDYEKRAIDFSKKVTSNNGRALPKNSDQGKEMKSALLKDVSEVVQDYWSLKKGGDNVAPVDITFGEFIKETYGFATSEKGGFDQYLNAIGVNPSSHTIESLLTLPQFRDAGTWLIPEIIVEAVRLGIEQTDLNRLVAATKTVGQPQVTVPHINMGTTVPQKMGEAERFKMGRISYGSKQVGSEKVGIGVEITDEVRQFTAIDLLAVELSDIGRLMAIAETAYMIETLINGEQTNGSYAAPIVGVDTIGSIAYKDLRRVSTRMKNLQRLPQDMLSNEATELDISLLPEVIGYSGGTTLLGLTPDKADIRTLRTHSHGLMNENHAMLIDPTSAIIRLIVRSLLVENEREASRQLDNVYISKTIGFYKLKRDAAVILDKTLDFASNGFPAWMDIEAFQRNTRFGGV